MTIKGNRATPHRAFWLILAAYLLFACVYSIGTPIFEASDELWHYPMVKYVADNGFTLPVQDPRDPGPMRQEGSQPPLYYMIGAALTAWIDTSDTLHVRVLNPHPDLGVIRPDGNINTVVHDPAREAFPWRGTVLAVHIVRLFSAMLGAVTVGMAYLLARELFPGAPVVALGAAVFTAFNPMFLFIAGAINNDNLSTMLASVLLWQIVRLVKQTHAPTFTQLIGIGVVAGAGMLAKFNIGFMLPMVALALGIVAARVRSVRVFVIGGLLTGGLTILISAWWYLRNWTVYGDPTGLNIFLRIVGEREIPANLPQLWSERHTFLMSYWGFFGGVNLALPDIVYTVFNGIAALSLTGLIGLALTSIRARRIEPSALNIARALSAIWVVVLFVSLLRWTQATWASQGRLLFAGIAPLSLGMALGLWALGRPIWFVRWRLVGYSGAWFLAIASLSPLLIARSYRDPDFLVGLPSIQSAATLQQATFADEQPDTNYLRLNQCCDFPKTVQPGQYLTFDVAFNTSDWQPSATEWSVFVHLLNKDNLIVAQRDVLLRQGQWSTRQLQIDPPGQQWINRFSVLIPDHAYAPDTLRAYLGFYNNTNPSQRMRALRNAVEPVEIRDNAVYIGAARLVPRSDSALFVLPNSTGVNFGNAIELVGWDASALIMTPGQQVTISLYWRARQKLNKDYSAFVHVFNPATTEIFGGADGMAKPSSGWERDDIIRDDHTFTIRSDALPGTWQIEIGLYFAADGRFDRLRIVTPDGGQAQNFLLLSRVRIDPK